MFFTCLLHTDKIYHRFGMEQTLFFYNPYLPIQQKIIRLLSYRIILNCLTSTPAFGASYTHLLHIRAFRDRLELSCWRHEKSPNEGSPNLLKNLRVVLTASRRYRA